MSPDGEEALYPPSGQEGCTDGTLTSLSRMQQINNIINHYFRTTLLFPWLILISSMV